jgi:hypothetical protein
MSWQIDIKTAGNTGKHVDIQLLQNAGSTAAGDPILGLAYNTSNLTCYKRIGATGAVTAVSLVTQTVTGAHSDGGFVKLDDTHCPGGYRFDIPDADLATAQEINYWFAGAAAGTAGTLEPHHLKIIVTAVDLFTAGGGVLTTQMTESYAATTVVPTAAQALQMILQSLLGFSGSGTTLTVYKRDNATQAMVGTWDSSSNATTLKQTT